jgi:serine/threonine protein kinase
LGKVLGQGGFGQVYKATKNNRDFAIKKIRTEGMSESELKDIEK